MIKIVVKERVRLARFLVQAKVCGYWRDLVRVLYKESGESIFFGRARCRGRILVPN